MYTKWESKNNHKKPIKKEEKYTSTLKDTKLKIRKTPEKYLLKTVNVKSVML